MRSAGVALCLLCIFAFAGNALAYYDDSVVIEIGDVLPHASTTNSSSQSGAQGGTGIDSTDSSAGGATSGSAGGSQGTGASENSTPGASSGTSDTASGSNAASGGTPPSETTVGGGLFDVLVSGGAISEGSALDTGSVNQSTSNTSNSASNAQSTNGQGETGGSFPSSENVAPGGVGGSQGPGGGGTMTIDAARVRQTLAGKVSFKQILGDYVAGFQSSHGQTLSDQDFGLMAASTILGDSNIEAISFGATQFQIVYRSQGYLLGFIPKSFSVGIGVNPQAMTPQERVGITLPWYHFFLRKLFSTSSLAQEIDAIISSEGSAQEGDSATDVKSRLFSAISTLLKKKVGTIDVSS